MVTTPFVDDDIEIMSPQKLDYFTFQTIKEKSKASSRRLPSGKHSLQPKKHMRRVSSKLNNAKNVPMQAT